MAEMQKRFELPLTKRSVDELVRFMLADPSLRNRKDVRPTYWTTRRAHDFFFYTTGETPITAIGDGIIVEVKEVTAEDVAQRAHTNNVVLDLGNERYADYMHIRPQVKPGQQVLMGDRIGTQHPGFGDTVKHFHMATWEQAGEEEKPYAVQLKMPVYRVPLRKILENVVAVVNAKGLQPRTIGAYQFQLQLIVRGLPRQESYNQLIPQGIDTNMDAERLERFLRRYQNQDKNIRGVHRERTVFANYLRRSFARLERAA